MGEATAKRKTIGWVALALILGNALLCACGWLAWTQIAPFFESPGEGAKAERGYRASEPIIAALEAYHQDQGEYPPALDALIPTYLESFPPEADEMGVQYRPGEGSYQLEFSYVGPGMNRCVYTPEAGWDCNGYY